MVENKKEMALSTWWASLTVVQKERIASKIASKMQGSAVKVQYPECTVYWNSLPLEEKEYIHNHCVDAHGYLIKEWFDGTPYGD